MGLTLAFFLVFLAAFLGIGVFASTRKSDTTDDYLVASRGVSPAAMALSAVATNNSGFMFMGLIGATYSAGISAMWIMVGWIVGDWVAWFFVHERLRTKSAEQDSTTIPSFIGSRLKGGQAVVAVAGLITLCFLGVYAAAQLAAGAKALHAVFDWDIWVGALIGTAMVVAYCFAGGIRASIWTDVAQSLVMLVAMVAVCAIAVWEEGGLSQMWSQLDAIGSAEGVELTDPFPSALPFGFAGYVLGWMGAGLGVVGQPHVMIRAMTLNSPRNMATARRIYMAWYLAFTFACIATGLAARTLLSDLGDPELALPTLATELVGPALVGLVLAGLFAATISTADSQILSCSAAITQDLFPGLKKSYRASKAATLGVAACSLSLLLLAGEDSSVFALVTLAWSTLASGLGPLLIVRALGWKLHTAGALATMVSGVAASLTWKYILQYSDGLYEVMPGMAVGMIVYLFSSKILPDGRDNA